MSVNSGTAAIEFIDAEAARAALGPADAVAAVRQALRDGLRPEDDHARIAEPLSNGEFLLMPSESPGAVGLKMLTVAPHNPGLGLPRIQGLYVLFDATTLAPQRLIDGPALTDLRTAAVSFAAVHDSLLSASVPLRVVVYGAGPQARAHVRTLRAVLDGHREIASVTCIVRTPDRVTAGPDFGTVVASGSEAALSATADAGLIVCATTARTPLFDGAIVRDDAIVIAVGSHEADARELDSGLMGRSNVIVEDRGVALRECGDVVIAVADGELAEDDLLPMADAVRGSAILREGRPTVFKSAGMPWQDLVVASAIARAVDARVA